MKKLFSVIIIFILLLSGLIISIPNIISASPTYVYQSYFPDTGDDGWTHGGTQHPATNNDQSHSPSYSMKFSTSSTTSWIRREFTAPTETFQWSFWIRQASTTYFTAKLQSGSNGYSCGPEIRFYAGNVEYYNHTIAGYSDSTYDYVINTWYKVFIEVTSASNYQDFYLYWNNASSGRFCHGVDTFSVAPNGTKIGFLSSQSTYAWVDDIKLGIDMEPQEGYEGEDFDITTIPLITASVDIPYYYDVDTSDAPDMGFAVYTNASFLDIDADTGEITGTPDSGDVNQTYYVNIEAGNPYYTHYQNYTLKVFPENINFTGASIFRGLQPCDSSSSGVFRYGNILYLAYQGYGNGVGNTSIYAQSYNYLTDLWTFPVFVDYNDDDASGYPDVHGSPNLAMDSLGYIHIFYGCHFTPLRHSRSDTPFSMASFTRLDDLDNSATYPACYVSTNGTMYVIYRDSSPGESHPWSASVSEGNGLDDTWVHYDSIIELGTGHALYPRWVIDNDKMWFSTNDNYYAPDYQWEDVACFYLNLTTMSMYGYDGTSFGDSMGLSEYNSHALVVDFGSPSTGCYGTDIRINSLNRPQIVYGHYTGPTSDYRHLSYNGATWDETIICDAGLSTTWINLYNDDSDANDLKVYLVYYDSITVGETAATTQLWNYTDGIWSYWGSILNDKWNMSEKCWISQSSKVTDRNSIPLSNYQAIIYESSEDGGATDYSTYCKMYYYDTSNHGTFYYFNGEYGVWGAINITSTPSTSAYVGIVYTYNAIADGNGTWSVVSNLNVFPAMGITQDGILMFVPRYIGTYWINVSIVSGESGGYQNYSIVVTVYTRMGDMGIIGDIMPLMLALMIAMFFSVIVNKGFSLSMFLVVFGICIAVLVALGSFPSLGLGITILLFVTVIYMAYSIHGDLNE